MLCLSMIVNGLKVQQEGTGQTNYRLNASQLFWWEIQPICRTQILFILIQKSGNHYSSHSWWKWYTCHSWWRKLQLQRLQARRPWVLTARPSWWRAARPCLCLASLACRWQANIGKDVDGAVDAGEWGAGGRGGGADQAGVGQHGAPPPGQHGQHM